jgi:hypothetical protein
MDGTGKRRAATAENFHRLADLAHQRGLRLFRGGSRWYCSSASDAGGCHYVTGLSCDCRGFVAHGRCSHHALLLERLGWLPEIDDDDPLPPAVAVVTGLELGRLSAEVAWTAGTVDTLRELERDAREANDQSTIDCPDCCGCGVVHYRTHEQPCDVCGGCGLIAA